MLSFLSHETNSYGERSNGVYPFVAIQYLFAKTPEEAKAQHEPQIP